MAPALAPMARNTAAAKLGVLCIGARGACGGLDARVKIAFMLAYSVALFCAKGLAGLGVAAALLAAVALLESVSLVRLLRERAFAYLIVSFLLVYNIVAFGWLAGGCSGGAVGSVGVGGSFAHGAFHTHGAFRGAAPAAFPPGPSGPARARLHNIAFHCPAVHASFCRGAGGGEGRPGLTGSRFRRATLKSRLRTSGLRRSHGTLFVGLFRRADRLASAMEARCYGASGEPTSLDGRRFSFGDGATFLVGVVACTAFALIP